MLIDTNGAPSYAPFVFDGVIHPRNIESRWTDAQLAAIGLTRVADPVPEPYAPTLAEYAAQMRFAKETGGVTLNGAQIDTDRESQAMISGAFNYVREKPAATIQFKTAAGFVALDAATVETIALAVGDHVQACFAKEAEVLAAIAAGTITTQSEIDQAFAAI